MSSIRQDRPRRSCSCLPFAVALLAMGCGASAEQVPRSETPEQRQPAGPPEPAVEAWRGPAVQVDAARLAKDQATACAMTRRFRVGADKAGEAASAAGMLPDDLESLRQTLDRLDVTVTLRDSNPACEPHLRAGMESKGHDVMTKTFTLESLPEGFEDLAGTVSTLTEKPRPGVILSDPMSKRHLTKDGKPLTCDYDLMDMIAADGGRIVGESARDLEVREALNAGLPLRGSPPRRVDRIRHGAQAEYPAYLRALARRGERETVHLVLMKPERPLTLLDKDGSVHRLPEIEDALNFYRCVGAPLPPEWNIEARPSAGKTQ